MMKMPSEYTAREIWEMPEAEFLQLSLVAGPVSKRDDPSTIYTTVECWGRLTELFYDARYPNYDAKTLAYVARVFTIQQRPIYGGTEYVLEQIAMEELCEERCRV